MPGEKIVLVDYNFQYIFAKAKKILIYDELFVVETNSVNRHSLKQAIEPKWTVSQILNDIGKQNSPSSQLEEPFALQTFISKGRNVPLTISLQMPCKSQTVKNMNNLNNKTE